jgi:hypothetical protein
MGPASHRGVQPGDLFFFPDLITDSNMEVSDSVAHALVVSTGKDMHVGSSRGKRKEKKAKGIKKRDKSSGKKVRSGRRERSRAELSLTKITTKYSSRSPLLSRR